MIQLRNFNWFPIAQQLPLRMHLPGTGGGMVDTRTLNMSTERGRQVSTEIGSSSGTGQ